MSDAAVDRVINRSFWEVVDKIPLREKQRTERFTVEAGVALYQKFSDLEAIRSVSVEDPTDGKHYPVTRFTREAHEDVFVNSDDMRGRPEYYYREGACIRFYPVPDLSTYTISITHLYELADIVGDFPLRRVYYDIVLFGAIWRQFLTLKNTSMAMTYKSLQAEQVKSLEPEERKEEKDARYAGVEVMLPEYP